MNPIRFLRVSYLGGPNIWTYRPVLESWIDIGELEDHPSHLLPGLYQRLTAWHPEEQACHSGGPVRMMIENSIYEAS